MARSLPCIFIVIAVTLLAWACYDMFFTAPQTEPMYTTNILARRPAPMVVKDTERNLGEIPSGVFELTFAVTNPSNRPAQIVGMTES